MFSANELNERYIKHLSIVYSKKKKKKGQNRKKDMINSFFFLFQLYFKNDTRIFSG